MLKETLEKTLPSGELSLPDSTPVENKLGLALKDLSDLAAREGKVTGTAATAGFFAERGINPEDLPGSSIGQMLAFVDRAMVDPVHKRAEAVGDILQAISVERSRMQQTALQQMDVMMSQDMWNDFISKNPGQAKDLWKASGFLGEPYRIPVKPSKFDYTPNSPLPGYTMTETNDLYNSENVKGWYIERLLKGMSDEEKKSYTFLKDLSREEVQKISGRAPEGDAEKWGYNLPVSRIMESPEFQKYAQEQWDIERRNPGGGSYSVDGSYISPIQRMSAMLLEAMESKEYTDEEIKSLANDINFNQQKGYKLTDGQIKDAIKAVQSNMPATLSEVGTLEAVADIFKSAGQQIIAEDLDDNFISRKQYGEIFLNDLAEEVNLTDESKQKVWEIYTDRYLKTAEGGPSGNSNFWKHAAALQLINPATYGIILSYGAQKLHSNIIKSIKGE
jgi:hypothetical protein